MDSIVSQAADDSSRYRLLVDSISDYAIFMLDAAGYVRSWNPGAERFKGYTRDEILGQHFSRFYTPEDRAIGLPTTALNTARTKGRFENEGWRVRKDGSRFWANVIIDPVYGPNGDVIGFAKVTRDQTERRSAEAELRRSEERFRYLVQSVTDYAIYMLDPQGYVTNWNSGAQKIKGYSPEEIIGQHFSIFYTPEDRAKGEPARSLATALEVGRFERDEAIRVRKDGTRFWANVVIDPVRDERGELIGFAKVTRDISERKQAEQALAQANEELMQSQKMEAIGRLTGGVAHDFNNLLMAITGSLELLRKRLPEDEKTLKLLDNAMQGAQRGASLTQRMLAFARRQDLKLEPVEMSRLIEGMGDLLTRSLGPAIEVDIRVPSLPPVLIDANQLELAILNLAVNAKDAMPDGGWLSIKATEETNPTVQGLPPGRYIRLSLADTGTGMDEATLSHATEPFFTTKGVGKGTGLGLAMVRGLTEQAGGTLRIDSTPGTGTTINLWLPVTSTEATGNSAQPTKPATAVEERQLKVLVVDDDLLVAMNTTAMLEDLGHQAIEVHSGRLALDALDRAADFDLMITDQAMPQMTGTQLASAARTKRPSLSIILATGYAELPPDADQSLPRLSKPFTQSDLARAIRELGR